MQSSESQIKYNDFAPNMNTDDSAPKSTYPKGPINHKFEFLDVSQLKQNRKKDGTNKYHARVPALNQTDYFLTRQELGSGLQQKVSTTKNQKQVPGTAFHSNAGDGEDDPAFLVFDKTADNGAGIQIHKSQKSSKAKVAPVVTNQNVESKQMNEQENPPETSHEASQDVAFN